MMYQSIITEYLRITGPKLREQIINEFSLLGHDVVVRAIKNCKRRGMIKECPTKNVSRK